MYCTIFYFIGKLAWRKIGRRNSAKEPDSILPLSSCWMDGWTEGVVLQFSAINLSAAR